MSKPIIKLVKGFLGLFPPSWPFRVYNLLLKVSFLRHPLNLLIQSMVADHIDMPEGKVVFDPEDSAMAGSITLGNYEPEMMKIFRGSLREGMNVIDIGANLGYFTVIAAGRVGPSGKVFSYEPDPHNFDLLKKNIMMNNFSNATPLSIALSDRAGKRELFFGDNNTTHSFGDKRGTGKSESVITDTLDNSLKSKGNPRIDLIKMDIEGAEPIALEGMLDTITRNPKLTIIFEFHPNAIQRLGSSPVAFLERVRELGFSLAVIDEDKMTHRNIDDIEAFAHSFQGKELSRNIIATR